jgi:hypothetical protein
MTRRIILGISAATTVGLVFLAGLAVAQKQSLKEQLVGTWLVVAVDNIRRDGSRFQSLGPNPKGILMFDANGWFAFQLAQPARPKFASETLKFDGKDYPRTVTGSLGGPRAEDTIALQRIDTYTLEETLKKGGEVVATFRQAVSKDGKERTATQMTGTNAAGQPLRNVLVFDNKSR